MPYLSTISSQIIISDLLLSLERVIPLFSGTDLHYIFHFVHKNLPVSDIACVKSFPGCL